MPLPKNAPQPDPDEEEVFNLFGITEEDEQRAVRASAAARVLASRKLAKKEPEPPKKRNLF